MPAANSRKKERNKRKRSKGFMSIAERSARKQARHRARLRRFAERRSSQS